MNLLKKLGQFFIWQYSQIDKLREDDNPNQTMALFLAICAMEGFAVWYLLKTVGMKIFLE